MGATAFAFAVPVSGLSVAARVRRAETIRSRPRVTRVRCAAAPDAADQPAASPPMEKPASEEQSGFYEGVPPSKVALTPDELAVQRRDLGTYGDELRNKRIIQEVEDLKLFGWVPAAEKLNGRAAMFFIVTGLLTELWTGYSIPGQVELLLETLGVL